MGSDSDLATMRAAAEALEGLGVPAEVTIVSAHRTPERMVAYARGAHTRGLQARRPPGAAGVLSLWRLLCDGDPGDVPKEISGGIGGSAPGNPPRAH